MALSETTLSGAITADQTTIKVASATGFAKGRLILVDDEFMLQTAEPAANATTVIPVRRGVNGQAKAHPTSAVVKHGNPAADVGDWSGNQVATQTAYPLAGRQRRIVSYSAAGALDLPSPGTDQVAVINGTGALAMTLAVPKKDNDGDILTVISNGKAAHTVTLATAIGDAGSGYTVGTFPAGGQVALMFMAMNEIWVSLPSPWAGTVTNIDVSIS